MEESKDIISSLASLPHAELEDLYTDEFACLSVFRSLRGLAKQYVLNMLLLDTCIRESLIRSWVRSDAMSHHRAAMHKLRSLRIIQMQAVAQTQGTDSAMSSAPPLATEFSVKLNAQFRKCLLQVVSGKSKKEKKKRKAHLRLSTAVSKESVSRDEVKRYGKERWERLLQALVDCGQRLEELCAHSPMADALTKKDISEEYGICKVLVSAGLLQGELKVDLKAPKRSTVKLSMTSSGFRFLFSDLHSQIWTVIVGYLNNAPTRKLLKRDVLIFVFKLSFLSALTKYSTATLCDDGNLVERVIRTDMTSMGLLKCDSGAKAVWPTHLCQHLSAGHSQTKEDRDASGFIIVESTFKVYAYTCSKLDLSLIAKFSRIEYSLPNLVSAKITRNSLMEAVSGGIGVDLIVDYLEKYSHKRMRSHWPILPVNVTDQLRLWESEHRRLRMHKAHLLEHLRPATMRLATEVLTRREPSLRASLLAVSGAVDCLQAFVHAVDAHVFEHGTGGNVPKQLCKDLEQFSWANEHLRNTAAAIHKRYAQVFKTHAFDLAKLKVDAEKQCAKRPLENVIELCNDLVALHLPESSEAQSHLLWQNKEQMSVVVSDIGLEKIAEAHRKRSEEAKAKKKKAASIR